MSKYHGKYWYISHAVDGVYRSVMFQVLYLYNNKIRTMEALESAPNIEMLYLQVGLLIYFMYYIVLSYVDTSYYSNFTE